MDWVAFVHWKAAEKVALWLTIFASVTVLAVALGNSVARWWFPSSQTLAPIELPSPTTNTVTIPTPSADLFGIAPIEALSLLPTTLQIHLLGVLPSASPEQGMAVIRSANQIEETYQVGQSPAAGVTLKAVYADHVILERNGQMETLFFSQSSSATSQSLFLPRSTDTLVAPELKTAMPSTSVSKTPQTLDDLSRAFRQNPQQLLQQAGVEQAGKTYRLTADSRLTQFGLQPGDQVVSLNGIDLDSLQRDTKLQAQLRQSDSIRAEIKRGGQRLIINFSIK